mgnify:CR=1 FL=1
MKRLIREPEKPSFPAQCRVLAEAAVLWALLAAGAQLLLPGRKDGSARGRGPRVGCAAHLPCDPSGGRACLPGRGALSFAAAGRRGAVVVQAVLFAALHGSWTARAYALGMGLIFGWAARKAKSVWPGSALHIINNCLVFAARLAERGMG